MEKEFTHILKKMHYPLWSYFEEFPLKQEFDFSNAVAWPEIKNIFKQ